MKILLFNGFVTSISGEVSVFYRYRPLHTKARAQADYAWQGIDRSLEETGAYSRGCWPFTQ
ncbi:MAG: hypothetical protein WBZ29_14520 [Methanocella sp.]